MKCVEFTWKVKLLVFPATVRNHVLKIGVQIAVRWLMKVKVFTRDGCAYCPQVKKFLTHYGVEYDEIDAVDNEEYKKLGFASVPVVVYENHLMAGYNGIKLKQIVNSWKEDHGK